jgi:hypothetical protein
MRPMMKTERTHLIKLLGGRTSELQVEEELRFHLETLEQEFRRSGMTVAAARAASQERFGDLERIRRQCLEISRRSHPINQALKAALMFLFVVGLLLRAFTITPQFGRLADLSMTIAILGHLFLYLRGLLPAKFSFTTASSSPMFGKSSSSQ